MKAETIALYFHMDSLKEVITSFCLIEKKTNPTLPHIDNIYNTKQNLGLNGNPSVTRSLVGAFLFLEEKYSAEFFRKELIKKFGEQEVLKLVWGAYFPGTVNSLAL